MRDFFWIHMDSEFNLSLPQLNAHVASLMALFPHSQTVLLQQALALYHYKSKPFLRLSHR